MYNCCRLLSIIFLAFECEACDIRITLFTPARPASKPGRKVGNLHRLAGVSFEGHLKGCGLTELFSADDDKDKKVRLQAQYVHVLSNRIEALKNSVTPELAERLAHFEQLTRALSLGDTNPTEAPRLAADPEPAKPAPVVAETVAQRRVRWLDMYEAEEKREKRGALQRLADSENVDRSNMKKDIEKARVARDTERRAGTWTSQMVQDGKRKGCKTANAKADLPGTYPD